jgi:hypothetical protein
VPGAAAITPLRWAAFALLALALAPTSAAAQIEPSVLVGVVRADQRQEYNLASRFSGASGSRVGWTDTGGGGALLGWTLGAALRWSVAPRLSLVSEVALTWKGFDGSAEAMKALHVELPLLVEVDVLRLGEVTVALDGGFAGSRELSCSARLPSLPTPDGSGTAQSATSCGDDRIDIEDLSSVFGARVGPFRALGLSLSPELRAVIGRTRADGPGPFHRWQNRGLSGRIAIAR